MATYVTQTQLVNGYLSESELVQLTNDDGGDTVDTDVLGQIITRCEAEVDGYVGRRYSLPLAATPEILKDLACRAVVHALHRRRPGTLSDDLRADRKDITARLRDIATGVLTLGQQPEPSDNSGRRLITSGNAPTFGRSNLGDF